MDSPLSLKQIQHRLGVAQHVLIHLCEKGVITPEIADTEGRGRFREFSRRNLFEFVVALELRRYQIPVAMIGAIIQLLSSFERAAQKLDSGFRVPDALVGTAPQLDMWLFNGDLLVFQLGGKVNLGFSLAKILDGEVKQIRLERLPRLPEVYQSCLRVDLSQLAENASI